MGNDEQAALNLVTDAVDDENIDAAVRVNAAAALLLWSALESIAKHLESKE